MNEKVLIRQLEQYEPYNEQEANDRDIILDAITNQENVFLRDNKLCHMTASAWVVNDDRTKVLMAYHNIYDSWAWLGGHADGNTDLLAVAIKEAAEESGLDERYIRPISEDIFSLEVLPVSGHVKKGEYVSSHIHLNITYLIEAMEDKPLSIKEDENKGVKWFKRDEALEASKELWFVENVYKKLNEKLILLK